MLWWYKDGFFCRKLSSYLLYFKGQGHWLTGSPSSTYEYSQEWQLKLSENEIKKKSSPAGNRTPVSRVTGGDTYHYTTEDCCKLAWVPSWWSLLSMDFAELGSKLKLVPKSWFLLWWNKGSKRPFSKWNSHQSRKKFSFEPDLNQRPMDFCNAVSLLQSTALPTELSKDDWSTSRDCALL